MIFEGVQLIDYTGPNEVLGSNGYRVFTVGTVRDIINTTHNMKVIPSNTFYNHPDADIIVVPGGSVPHDLSENDE